MILNLIVLKRAWYNPTFKQASQKMGLLSEGKPLSWADTKKNAWIVHKTGILQFISIYHKLKDRKGDTLKWGDEVCNRCIVALFYMQQ